jgi:hypothetical protein
MGQHVGVLLDPAAVGIDAEHLESEFLQFDGDGATEPPETDDEHLRSPSGGTRCAASAHGSDPLCLDPTRLGPTGLGLAGLELTGLDLASLDLTSLDLTSLDLTGLDLTSLDLTSLDLTSLDLTGLDLTSLDLNGALVSQ